MNKQKILSILKQLYGKDSVIEDGNTTIILGVDFKDRKKRDDVAKYIAKKLKGIEKNRVVKVNQIKILIKPKTSLTSAKKKSPALNSTHYAFLQHFLSSHDTSKFSGVCDPVLSKTIPTKIKEKSDIEIIKALNSIIKNKIESEKNQDVGTTLIISGETYRHVICCVPIMRGDEPKADICLVCISGNSLIPKGYFSYKMGTKPSSFGGYSGISSKAGSSIFNHPEVKSFITALKEAVDAGVVWTDNSKKTLKIEPYRVIKDKKLQNLAVFGPEANSNERGPNNCDAILQGKPRLSGNVITFDHEHNRKSTNFSEGYVPVLGARKDSNRNLNYGNIIIEKMRIGIFHDGYRSTWKSRDDISAI